MARKKTQTYTALDAVSDIKKGKVHHLYVLKGAEVYFHDIVIKSMKNWAEKHGIDVEIIYADEISSAPENTGGGGMFSSGKLYIIKYWQTPKNKKVLASWERFFIDDEDLYYVVSIDTSSRSGFTIKTIEDRVDVSCVPLKGRSLKAFIKAAIKKRGKDITGTALEMLVSLSGGKLSLIVTELDKLDLIEENVITEDIISRYFALQAEGNVFVFWDALWSGDAGVAGEMKQAILLSGTPPAQILATIATFIRGVLEVGQLKHKGYSVKEIASMTSKNPYYIGKLLGIYDTIGVEGAISLLNKLYELDKGIKTGEITDIDALDAILSYIVSLRGIGL